MDIDVNQSYSEPILVNFDMYMFCSMKHHIRTHNCERIF